MKKYRLIKTYPGSPKLNTIIDLETAVNGQIIQGKWCYDIDKTPEYWKEVVKKDYEILSFIWNFGSYKPIYTLKNNLYCHDWKISGTNKYNQDELLNDKNYLIYSVRRLSDDEIFTIGDIVKINSNSIKYIITQIQINKNSKISISGNCIEQGISTFNNYWESINHIKQPLFKTEDGVDIFEGDQFYFIAGSDKKFDHNLGTLVASKNATAHLALARFSKKEKGEEYILMNKPCLSVNDVLSVMNFPKAWENILKGLVKQKLNKNN